MRKLGFLLTIFLLIIPSLCEASTDEPTPEPTPTGKKNRVGCNVDIHFGCQGYTANDYHAYGTVESLPGTGPPEIIDTWIFGDKEDQGVTWREDSHTLTEDPENEGTWHFTLDFKILETGQYIGYCEKIHFGIMFRVWSNEVFNEVQSIENLEGYWTLDGEKVCDVPLSGFGVDIENQMVTIFNDSDITIELIALEMAIDENTAPLEHMSREYMGLPAEPTPTPSPTPDPSSTPAPTATPSPVPTPEPPRSIKTLLDFLTAPRLLRDHYSYLDWKVTEGLPITLEPDATAVVYLEDLDIELSPGQYLFIRGKQIIEGAVNEKWAYFWEQRGADE